MIKSKRELFQMPYGMSIECNYPPSLQKYCTLNKPKADSTWEQIIMDLTDLNQLVQDICVKGNISSVMTAEVNQIVCCMQNRLYKYYSSHRYVIEESKEYNNHSYILGNMMYNAFNYMNIPSESIDNMAKKLYYTKKHKDHNNMVRVFNIIKNTTIENEDSNPIISVIHQALFLITSCKDFHDILKECEKIDPRYKKLFHFMARLFSSNVYKIASFKKSFSQEEKDNNCLSFIQQYITKQYPPKKFNIDMLKPGKMENEVNKIKMSIEFDQKIIEYKEELKKVLNGEIEYLQNNYSMNSDYPYPFKNLLSYFETIHTKLDGEIYSLAKKIELQKTLLSKAKKRMVLENEKNIERTFNSGGTFIIKSSFKQNSKRKGTRHGSTKFSDTTF